MLMSLYPAVVASPASADPLPECTNGDSYDNSVPSGPSQSGQADCEVPNEHHEETTPPSEGGDAGAMSASSAVTTFTVGARTRSTTLQGTYAAMLHVVDPEVAPGSGSYVSQHISVRSCSGTEFLEAGWIEPGWLDGRQYVYTRNYSNPNSFNIVSGWNNSYAISAGDTLAIEIVKTGSGTSVQWNANLYWNGQWQQIFGLGTNASLGCSENVVEVGSDGSPLPSYPKISSGNGLTNGVMVRTTSTSWSSWNTTIPTTELNSAANGHFTTSWVSKYYNVDFLFNNLQPTVNLSVSPAQGDLTTIFIARPTGSDPEADPLTYEIDWGDDTQTVGSSHEHRYDEPGYYQITAIASDTFGATDYAYQGVTVCAAQGQGCEDVAADLNNATNGALDELHRRIDACSKDPDNLPDPPGPGLVLEGDQTNNQIWGTKDGDIIFGRGGNDVIKGRGGPDIICAGAGNDGVNGGDGADEIAGGEGHDLIIAAAGDDKAWAGISSDAVFGGAGADVLTGGTQENVHDLQDDYVAGGSEDDVVRRGDNDETYESAEEQDPCPVDRHYADVGDYIPKIGVYNPRRLAIRSPDRYCLRIQGTITSTGAAGDGDRVMHVDTSPSSITVRVTDILSDPDSYDAIRLAKGDDVKVELMPRDYPQFIDLLPFGVNTTITVEGLYVEDENHPSGPNEGIELHPAFFIRYKGLVRYGGKKDAGSPWTMHPKGTRVNVPSNPMDFSNKSGANDWRYCWSEGGIPCKDFRGNETFG